MAKLRIAALVIVCCGCSSSAGKTNAPQDGSSVQDPNAPNAPDARASADLAGAGAADVSPAPAPDTAPPITSAPPAWVRPADCGGIGDTCPNGIFDCSSKSMCQLEGYVCVPLAPKTSDLRPYCMAYTCMSFDEASCFCTGAAAKQYPTCADGPAAVVGLCAATGASCASKACCDGLTCMSGTAICQRPCTTNTDCPSGCCFDEDNTGHAVCSTASLCTSGCGKVGASCSNGADCCTGLCNGATDVSDWVGCRRLCAKNSDCSTGCCEMYTGGASGGFCADARWCSCGTTGTACGSTSPPCCSDQACSQLGSDTSFVCHPQCKSTADCTVGTCSANFVGKDYGICYQ